MTTYSQISKKIGWNGTAAIPSLEHAQELHRMIRDERSEKAFEEVFRIYRFAPISENEHDLISLNVICDAYLVGSKIFR